MDQLEIEEPKDRSELEARGTNLINKLQQLSLELRDRVGKQRAGCKSLTCEVKSLLGALDGRRGKQ